MSPRKMRNYMNKIWNTLEAVFGGLCGLALGFIMPIWPFIATAIALVIADTITGVLAATNFVYVVKYGAIIRQNNNLSF